MSPTLLASFANILDRLNPADVLPPDLRTALCDALAEVRPSLSGPLAVDVLCDDDDTRVREAARVLADVRAALG